MESPEWHTSASAAPTGAPKSASTIGAYVDRTEAERTTLHEALDRYLREVVPGKRYPEQERTRIARWQKHDLAWRTLASLRGADFAKYRDARRTAGRAENTIRLELQLVSHVFEIARKEWGFETLTNPKHPQAIRQPRTGSTPASWGIRGPARQAGSKQQSVGAARF